MTPNPLASDLDDILRQTRPLWEELCGARLFITGGTGFFGCWLLESLLWAEEKLGLGVRVTVLTRAPDVFSRKAPHLAGHPSVRLHAGNVRDFAFPNERFSHIIHAAAESPERAGAPLSPVFDTLVEGTRRTLEFARSCGAGKLLLTSSGAVYGLQSPDLTHLPEEYPCAPALTDHGSAYAQGKRAAESLCTQAAREGGLDVKIARCFTFVGPYLPLDAQFAAGNFIRDVLRGVPIQVKGDGVPWRSYLYASDLTIWLWTILHRGVFCRPYNVGSEEAVRIADLAQAISRAVVPPAEVRIARAPELGVPAPRYVPSTRRARTELGLRQGIGLDEAIARTIRWHRSPKAA